MTTLLLAFFIMLLVVTIMSVGVLIKRKPIKGSCGGLSALGMKESCEICGGNQDECEKQTRKAKPAGAPLYYDASKSE